MKLGLPVALRWAIGIAALGLLVWRIDLPSAIQALRAVDFTWLAVAAVVQCAAKACWVLRWKILVVSTGHSISASALLRWILEGLFFNTFLPSTVGGDVIRTLGLASSGTTRANAAATVFADRVLGLSSLAILAVIGGALSIGQGWGVGLGLTSVPFAFALLVGGLVLARPSLLESFDFERRIPWGGAGAKLNRLLGALRFLTERRSKVSQALAMSVLLSFFSALFHMSVARSLGIEVSLIAYFVIVPAVMLSAAMPITVNGLGIRELGFVGFLGTQGVESAPAAAFALLAFLLPLVFALLGGVSFLLRGRQSQPDAKESTP